MFSCRKDNTVAYINKMHNYNLKGLQDLNQNQKK